jgi:thiol-disulfide isomerase/thioredoxin
LDTNTNSSKPAPLRAALALLAAGGLALLYACSPPASKPDIGSSPAEAGGGGSRFATGALARLQVIEDAPPMPASPLLDEAGATTSFAALAGGQVAVLNLWATWCAPCMTEMPSLGALQRRFEGRIRVIPINVDEPAKQGAARAQLARLSQATLPFVSDAERATWAELRPPGMPLTVIYGRDGRERARLVGGADWSSEEAAALIEAVLAEP